MRKIIRGETGSTLCTNPWEVRQGKVAVLEAAPSSKERDHQHHGQVQPDLQWNIIIKNTSMSAAIVLKLEHEREKGRVDKKKT